MPSSNEHNKNTNIALVFHTCVALTYVLTCFYSYPLVFEYIYPITHSAYFALCIALFCIYNIFIDLTDSIRNISTVNDIINQGQLLNKGAYNGMFHLIGYHLGTIAIQAFILTYILFITIRAEISFLQGSLFFLCSLLLFSLYTFGLITLIKSLSANYKWLTWTALVAVVIAYFVSLEILEFVFAISSQIQPRQFLIGIFSVFLCLLLIASGITIGFSGIWYFVNRFIKHNSDVLHILRSNKRNEKIVKGQHFLLLMFSNSTFNIHFLFIPLYFYCLLTFNTQSTLVILIIALNLPFLIKTARLLEPLSKEFFFVLFKSVISTLLIVTFASHVIYLLAYIAYFELGNLLNSLGWNLQDGVFPNYWFYFVRQPIQLDFLLAYIEGIIYAIVSSTIIVWLYAIFIRKEQYRFLWFLLTVSIFSLTVYYDNYVGQSKVAALVPWTLPPKVFIFSALPFLVHFIINVLAGPYRVNSKCHACSYKAPKLAKYCPSCGSYLHISKTMVLGLVKAFHQSPLSLESTETEGDEKKLEHIRYRHAGLRQIIECLGLLKQVRKAAVAQDMKARGPKK
ncbi:hypothetical protein Q4567_20670 [Aliiglaciecola sp. 2_MG-2023]|uniref:hypothetical protein n=1 Tax=unclassified Aliiglaciecola TaxID=2593648 RepID=UPI0026E3011B|nr:MULTISPECIES: hypothetical protein [unclassified Aliiglaciecola]MDO6713163.1 hypothetical protein [Aliiglaciecola sp. 2_MG-2023]MDO6754163.1 hypothetical protein [Aliiglaciecola sp. 1_MG-2023]